MLAGGRDYAAFRITNRTAAATQVSARGGAGADQNQLRWHALAHVRAFDYSWVPDVAVPFEGGVLPPQSSMTILAEVEPRGAGRAPVAIDIACADQRAHFDMPLRIVAPNDLPAPLHGNLWTYLHEPPHTPVARALACEPDLLSRLGIDTVVVHPNALVDDGGPRPAELLARFFLVSAASVWASPILYQYYVNLPLSAQQRMGGFFANPNEAAMASLLAVALVLGVPFRARLLQILLVLMAGGAVMLTFSKTAMSCLVVILAWHLLRRAKGIKLFILPVVAILAVAAIQDADEVLAVIAENELVELDQSQKDRILAVGKILRGEIDQSTSTGRTYFWGLVIEKAWDRFPMGGGIGSAHNVVGGIVENDTWQGAHNSFIMMPGESGPLPAALLVALVITLFLAVMRNPIGLFALPSLFALVIDMMATHGALGMRYHNLMLAIVLGLVANHGLAMLRRARPVSTLTMAQTVRARAPR